MTNREPIIEPRLAAVYPLDPMTLTTNHKGRMTDTQRDYLKRWRRSKLLRLLAISATAALLTIASVWFVAAACVRIFLLGVALIQLWRTVRFYRRSSGELAAGVVRMYEGRLYKKQYYWTRVLFCERGEFPNLPLREWDAFDHFGRYRVYCTPHTRIILAAQPIHQDEHLPKSWSLASDPT